VTSEAPASISPTILPVFSADTPKDKSSGQTNPATHVHVESKKSHPSLFQKEVTYEISIILRKKNL